MGNLENSEILRRGKGGVLFVRSTRRAGTNRRLVAEKRCLSPFSPLGRIAINFARRGNRHKSTPDISSRKTFRATAVDRHSRLGRTEAVGRHPVVGVGEPARRLRNRCRIGRGLRGPLQPQGRDSLRRVASGRRSGGGDDQGVLVSRGPIVHVLLCGARVCEGWCDAALQRFDDPGVAAVAPVLVDQDRPAVLLAAGGELRGRRPDSTSWAGTPRGGGRKLPAADRIPAPGCRLFPPIGPRYAVSLFSSDVGDWLTVLDLALSLQQAGLRTVLEPHCRVLAAAGADRRGGPFRRSLELERFFWRVFPRGNWAVAGWFVTRWSCWGKAWRGFPGWRRLPNSPAGCWESFASAPTARTGGGFGVSRLEARPRLP